MLHADFLRLRRAGAALGFGVWASPCPGFSRCRTGCRRSGHLLLPRSGVAGPVGSGVGQQNTAAPWARLGCWVVLRVGLEGDLNPLGPQSMRGECLSIPSLKRMLTASNWTKERKEVSPGAQLAGAHCPSPQTLHPPPPTPPLALALRCAVSLGNRSKKPAPYGQMLAS